MKMAMVRKVKFADIVESPIDIRKFAFIQQFLKAKYDGTRIDIAIGLDSHYQQTIYQLRKKFSEKMQADPANAIFALVEEIKDRLVRAKGIKDEWKSFLDPIREQLWVEELSRFNKEIALRKQWRNAVDDALKCVKQIRADFPN
jgi:hypothetical protein